MLVLALVAFLIDNSRGRAQQPPAPQPPAFTAALLAPQLNGQTNKYDIVFYGNFTNVPAPLRIRVTLRETPVNGNPALTTPAPLVTDQTPVPAGQQAGITRTPNAPQNGSYLGTVTTARYNNVTYNYHVKIVFETSGGGVIHTYKENNSEWVPVPKP